MSNKIYINQPIIDGIVYASGASEKITNSFGQTASELMGTETLNPPDIIRMYKQTLTPVTSDRIYGTYQKYSRLKNLKLQIINTNTDSAYQNSTYVKTLINKVTLNYTLTVTYAGDSYAITSPMTLSILGSLITKGNNSIYSIDVIKSFNNLISNKYPFDNISIDTTSGPSVNFTDTTTTPTTTEQIDILTMTRNIKHYALVGTSIAADTTKNILFSGTIPDTTNNGKLYLISLSASEEKYAHCLYKYNAQYAPLQPLYYPEPISSLFYRDFETQYDVYEIIKPFNTIYSRVQGFGVKEITDLVGIHTDTIGESFDNSFLYSVKCNEAGSYSTFSSHPTGLELELLERIAWLDGVVLRFTFRDSSNNITRATQWVPLIDCLLDGVDVKKGDYTVNIEIGLPDLCTLTANHFENDPTACYPGEYLGGFYPYNSIAIGLRIGYQSNWVSKETNTETNKTSGIYDGLNKIRRLFIDQEEIKYIVIDEEIPTT